MQMRPSRVLRKLRAGQVASCVKLNLSCPRAAEIAAMSGYDCIWLCMEHVSTDWMAAEHHIRAAKIYDVDAMMRVPRGSYSDHIRPLEMDAAGIMVPHVMSLADAKKVVWQTRFHPVGRRPIDGGNQDGAYCMIPYPEYVKVANEQRFVIIQIEDPEPLDELDEIAKLEGIDGIFFGPGDFSHGCGIIAQWTHPKITDTRKRIAEVCLANGKYAGTVGSPDNLQELVDMGYRFLCCGADVIGLVNYFKEIVAAFAELRVK